jgi:glutamate/tyrosine decarboxylase-like PLP-dependent enzyme
MEVRPYDSMGNFEKKPLLVCAKTSQEATQKAIAYAEILGMETRFVVAVIEHPDEVCYTHHYND